MVWPVLRNLQSLYALDSIYSAHGFGAGGDDIIDIIILWLSRAASSIKISVDVKKPKRHSYHNDNRDWDDFSHEFSFTPD